MTANTTIDDSILLKNAPAIEGLRFRHFRGDEDFPKMVDVLEAANRADQVDEATTAEQMARYYANHKNSDPYRDVVMAEIVGKLIGYKRTSWYKELDGTHMYDH